MRRILFRWRGFTVWSTPAMPHLAGWRQEIWFAANVNGDTTVQVTATFDAAFDGERAMSAHQYDGALKIDQTREAAGSAGSASVGPVTVSQAELVFAAALFPSSPIIPGPGTAQGFFQRSNLGDNVTEDKQFVNATTDATATFTNDQTQAWIAQLVTAEGAWSPGSRRRLAVPDHRRNSIDPSGLGVQRRHQ